MSLLITHLVDPTPYAERPPSPTEEDPADEAENLPATGYVTGPRYMLHRATLEFVSNMTSTSSASTHYRLVSVVPIRLPNTDVYLCRGKLVQQADAKPYCEALPVVVKVSLSQSAFENHQKEGRLYAGALSPLSGRVVPKCYGFYETDRRQTDDTQPYGCLVLQDCGEPLWSFESDDLRDPEETRPKLAEARIKVHDCSVLHGSPKPHHFVLNDAGEPFLIDFQHAEENRACIVEGTDGVLPEYGSLELDANNFTRCAELYFLYRGLQMWVQSTFRCFDGHYDARWVCHPAEFAVAHMSPSAVAQDVANEVTEAICRYMMNNYPDDLGPEYQGETSKTADAAKLLEDIGTLKERNSRRILAA